VRVHVTGGSGFLGRRVLPLLLEHGHDVTALARSAAAAGQVEALGAKPVHGDLDDGPSLVAAFVDARADALVNLASLGFGHAPGIVTAAEEVGIPRAVFVSTTALFTALDAGSKAVRIAAEDAIRASSLSWTIIRPTMIYGAPDDRNLARLLGALKRWPIMPLPGGGRSLQQPVHVDDVALAVVTSLTESAAVGQSYNVAGPEAMSLRDLVEQASGAVGRRPRVVPIPLRPVVSAVRAYEALASRPRLRAEQFERLAEDKAVDIEPARRDLGYRPRPFAEGIREEAALLG
jgi:uncharacterized protein YbjT (DUF2867 family)